MPTNASIVNGLRPEIIDKMLEIKFDKLEEATKIAIQAKERFNQRNLINSNQA